jgi:hypothetical protein
MNGSNNFESLSQLITGFSIKSFFKLLDLMEFNESCIILVRFEIKEGNIPFDFASFSMDIGEYIFVDIFDNS